MPEEPKGVMLYEVQDCINESSIRAAPAVDQQPTMQLLQWRIVEVPGGHRLVLGWHESRPTVRITTAIARTSGRDVWTSSGRRYDLSSAPAEDPDALAGLWSMLKLHGHFVWVDVTERFVRGEL